MAAQSNNQQFLVENLFKVKGKGMPHYFEEIYLQYENDPDNMQLPWSPEPDPE
jgi:hypothetical protein